MEIFNAKIAEMLRQVAAAYTLKKGNLFQIRAYDTAADSIEHSTSEVKDLWEEGNLKQISGVGESIAGHLDELFKTGTVKHWEEVKKGIPEQVFEFLNIPGVGPKTAQQLAKLGVESVNDLQAQIKSGLLVKKGFSAKIAEKIMDGIRETEGMKKGRMLLPYAFVRSQKVLDYLKRGREIQKAEVLGSLRRMVATVGDLDFAVASREPKKAIEYIVAMPGVTRVAGRGETKVTLVVSSGLQFDFRIVAPESYGALLQYFTGSKSHNIHLRLLAEKKGLSFSEYGVKNIKTGKIHPAQTEDELYKLLEMQTPPSEIREDTGEIEAALAHQLPRLVTIKDIKGDLHIHSNFSLESSHGPGADSLKELVEEAEKLGYEYIGISDHSPGFTNHTYEEIIRLIKDRTEEIDYINYSQKKVRVLNLLEIDILPNGTLSVPDEGLKLLDFALAGVHSSHRMPKSEMTKRILKALENPYVKVLTHPTGRILNERESYEVDWPEIFKFAAKNKKAMEIDAFYNRLDLPDTLAREARELGAKFTIDTDAHEKSQMVNMKFGVAVARRGWLTKDDVINSWDLKKMLEWFKV